MPSLVSAGSAPQEEAAPPGRDAAAASASASPTPEQQQQKQQQPEANDEASQPTTTSIVPPGHTPIATPHVHDVLCTRGTHRHHAGNVHFRNLISSHKAEYARLRARQRDAAAQGPGRRLPVDPSGTPLGKVLAAQKGEIAMRMVRAVRSLSPPGRFLRRVDEEKEGEDKDKGSEGRWVEIGDEKAVQKAQQALRDGAHDRWAAAWGRKRQATREPVADDDSDGNCGGPDPVDHEWRGPEQRANAVLGAMAPFAWRCLAGAFGPMPAAVARRQDVAGHFGPTRPMPQRPGGDREDRGAGSPEKKHRRRAASAEGENGDDGGKEASSKSAEKKASAAEASGAAGAENETSSGDAQKKTPESGDSQRVDQPDADGADQTSNAASAEGGKKSDADGPPPSEKRRRVNGGKFCPLPADATTILGRWLESHIDHPYATPQQMTSLVESTGLHKEQVKEWLKKARRKRGLSRRRGRGRRRAAMAEHADPAADLHAAVDDLQRQAREAGIDNPVDLWRAMLLRQGMNGNPPVAADAESNSGDQEKEVGETREGATAMDTEVEAEDAKERPKRPLNAYLSFIKEALPRVKEQHPDLSQKEVMVKAAQAYRELGSDERKRYDDMAAAAMAKFREDHGADALRHWKKKKKKKRRRTGEKTKGQSADAARAAAMEAGPEAALATDASSHPTDEDPGAAGAEKRKSGGDEPGRPASNEGPPPSEKRRRVNGGKFCPLPADATSILRRWLDSHVDHPYATREQMMSLVESTGLGKEQVKEWLKKARRRRGMTRRNGWGRRGAAMAANANATKEGEATAKERPKRPLNAYLSFMKEALPKMKERYPDISQKEVMTKAAKAYRELGDGERKRYEDAAAAAMAKFREELGEEAAAEEAKETKEGEATANERPKRPLNAYLSFMKEALPKMKEAHPDITQKEVMAKAAKAYRELGDDERKRYEDAAAAAMAKFREEHGEEPPDPDGTLRDPRALPAAAATTLQWWLLSHRDRPSATPEQLASLVEATGLSEGRVKKWLADARRQLGGQQRQWQQALTAGMMMNPVHAPPMMSHGMSGNLPFAAAMGSHIDAGTGQFAQGSFTAMPLDLNAMAGGMMNPVGVGRQEKRKRTGGRTGNDGSQLDKTWDELVASILPDKPKKPHTAYKLCYELERELKVREEFEVTEESEDCCDPDMPPRYKHLMLAKDWYKSLEEKPKFDEEVSQRIAELRWKEIDAKDPEVRPYCEKIAKAELDAYKEAMEEHERVCKNLERAATAGKKQELEKSHQNANDNKDGDGPVAADEVNTVEETNRMPWNEERHITYLC